MSNLPSINEIRRTLRAAFPNAGIKASKIINDEEDIELIITSDASNFRRELEAFVVRSYCVEYMGKRCLGGHMLGYTYGEGRANCRHRWDFNLR